MTENLLVLQGKPVTIFTRPYQQTTRKYERTSVNFEPCAEDVFSVAIEIPPNKKSELATVITDVYKTQLWTSFSLSFPFCFSLCLGDGPI